MRFSKEVSGAGAVATFSGLVRDEGGSLSAMEIEHYPGMTEKALEDIRKRSNEALVSVGRDDHPPPRIAETRRADHDGRDRRQASGRCVSGG